MRFEKLRPNEKFLFNNEVFPHSIIEIYLRVRKFREQNARLSLIAVTQFLKLFPMKLFFHIVFDFPFL